MRVRLISTDGEEGGVAVFEVNGKVLRAMDCLSYGESEAPYPMPGNEFEARFTCLHGEEDSWNSVFDGNLAEEQGLESTGLWSYRAFGKLVAIDDHERQAIADCGLCLLPLPIEVSDPAYLGQFITFDVERLDIWRK